jgi:hypothetical protein
MAYAHSIPKKSTRLRTPTRYNVSTIKFSNQPKRLSKKKGG